LKNKIGPFQIFLIILVTLLWASCFPLIELGHRAAPPLLFAAIRSFIAGSFLLIPLLIARHKDLFIVSVWKSSLYVAMTYTVLGLGGMFLADGRVSTGISTVLANTQPIITTVLAFFFLDERMTKKNVLGLLCSFLGIALVATNGKLAILEDKSYVGILFILMGAFGTGAGNVLMKKLVSKVDPIVIVTIQFLLGSFILYVLSYTFEGSFAVKWHPSFFWSLVILAIPGTALATLIWLYLLKKIPLMKLSVFTFLTPAFGLIIGFMFFNEEYSTIDINLDPYIVRTHLHG
jgi:drug/metabolite transporter (DMT)-like permease